MEDHFDPRFPSVEHLRERTARRLPRFVLEYLEGGCNSEINLRRNTEEIREVRLMPRYLGEFKGADLKTELFGQTYEAPFGVSPIGLQGMIWPRATEFLAAAATKHGLPFILSTVATASIETVAEITGGKAWFQLYHPVEEDLRNKLLDRVEAAGLPVLVILADTPVFGYRPREIRNGLAMPPKMTLRNITQMMTRPRWSLSQLANGVPEFATLKPYLPGGLDMKHLGLFMNRTFSGRLNPARLASLRDRWRGKLVVKGLVSEEDVETALGIGVDGIIVSNHGGRQLDAGESTIAPLTRLARRFGDRTTLMIDSGLRSGPDIACALASGARFGFLGRSFMYGVAALGEKGGDHTMTMLKRQLRQVMEQLACERTRDFPHHRIGAGQD
ncbi:MAG: alpha-hydroxy-acid oxidizing enzyme [Verrucomicrobiia bacterium Tous-C2TDCM]|nr:MAG: alpha-hydroxy-acid oxidizing enzyme [Verrucomicrobiae bacterium Tous-C2TDCM]